MCGELVGAEVEEEEEEEEDDDDGTMMMVMLRPAYMLDNTTIDEIGT